MRKLATENTTRMLWSYDLREQCSLYNQGLQHVEHFHSLSYSFLVSLIVHVVKLHGIEHVGLEEKDPYMLDLLAIYHDMLYMAAIIFIL
jgi:hypothetical protein